MLELFMAVVIALNTTLWFIPGASSRNQLHWLIALAVICTSVGAILFGVLVLSPVAGETI